MRSVGGKSKNGVATYKKIDSEIDQLELRNGNLNHIKNVEVEVHRKHLTIGSSPIIWDRKKAVN